MNAAYGSSGSFGSRVRSKSMGYSTYTGRISNFSSNPRLIHLLVHKYYLSFSYLTIYFSPLPQAVSKGIINCLYQKVSYAYMTIDKFINIFSLNEIKFHLKCFDNSIINFCIRGLVQCYQTLLMLTFQTGLEEQLLIRSNLM